MHYTCMYIPNPTTPVLRAIIHVQIIINDTPSTISTNNTYIFPVSFFIQSTYVTSRDEKIDNLIPRFNSIHADIAAVNV